MNRVFLIAVLPFLALLGLWGCDNDVTNTVEGPGSGLPMTEKTCLSCHSSQEELLASLGGVKGPEITAIAAGDG